MLYRLRVLVTVPALLRAGPAPFHLVDPRRERVLPDGENSLLRARSQRHFVVPSPRRHAVHFLGTVYPLHLAVVVLLCDSRAPLLPSLLF